MSEQFDSMMEGLTDLLEYAKGDKTKAHFRVIEIKSIQVNPLKQYSKEEIKQIRIRNNFTQSTFAAALGVSSKAIEAWESGRNKPNGSTIRILQIIEQNPGALEEYNILTKS